MKPLAMLALIASVSATNAAAQTPVTAPEGPSVVVTVGEAVVKRAPDRAWVTIAAESRAKTPSEAQKLNSTAMSDVMLRVRGAGVPTEAIKTVSYELRPEFDFVNNKQTLRGYVARNAVEVRIDDLARLGQVLDVAVTGGATSIGGIRFDLKDRAAAEQEALQMAVADARAQANTAAQAASMKVDRVLRIEVGRESPMPPPRPMPMRMEMAGVAAEPPISPGELEIRATVTLTSAIK